MSGTRAAQRTELEVFWGEIAPCDHLVQIYTDDTAFLDSLAGFVSGGLKVGEAVIVIATQSHRSSLDFRLRTLGIDIEAARREDLYIPLDAQETLSKFMVNGWPDDERFRMVVNSVLARARKNACKIRAFGEMVALLWAAGHNGATVRLEHVWTQFCKEEAFSLFCAYPRSGFTKDADASIREICSAHSRVISAASPRRTTVPAAHVAA
jgi:hypothetical protein